MINKKYLYLILCVILIIMVIFLNKKDSPKFLAKEGIAPYKLSESEMYILKSFGMNENSQIISFNAPKNAVTLKVNAYKYTGNKKWSSIGCGSISIGKDNKLSEQLSGTFTMGLGEKYVINCIINSNGIYSFKTDEILLDNEPRAFLKCFLRKFNKIEINKEIPVALIVYDSDEKMETHSLEDYFNPSNFKGKDLVQVVTLTFTDKEL